MRSWLGVWLRTGYVELTRQGCSPVLLLVTAHIAIIARLPPSPVGIENRLPVPHLVYPFVTP